MIWNFYIPQILYFHPILQQQDEGKCTTIQSSVEPQKILSNVRQNYQISSFILNLSVEDLKKAGYDTNKTSWSEEQDQKLKQLRDVQLLDWYQLAKLMPGRNSKMCYSRYRRLENKTKDPWKKKDNERLIALVEQHGEQWKEISKFFQRRTHKQVKEHYLNYLRPEIKKDQWSLQEDVKLVSFLNKFGKNWKVIEENFQGRTQNQIKNRYFGRLKRLAEKKVAIKEKICKVQKQERKNDNL